MQLVLTILVSVADAANHVVFDDQVIDPSPEMQRETIVFSCFADDETQKLRLRDHGYERKLGPESGEVAQDDGRLATA